MSSPFVKNNAADNSPRSENKKSGLGLYKLQLDISKGLINENDIKSPEEIQMEKGPAAKTIQSNDSSEKT